MKKYSDPGAVQWDAWFVHRGNTTHMFYLKNGPLGATDPSDGWSVGHATTENGYDWTVMPSVLPPLFDDSNPMDYHSKFTGCAVNRDDVCYLFYTMRDKDKTNQRIGVAISKDWEHFVPWENNPVVVNDDRTPIPRSCPDGKDQSGTLIGYRTLPRYDWNMVDCRDFIVVEDQDSKDGKKRYYGYWAAAADLGAACPVGVIVMAQSYDLLHWSDQRIVYAVDHHGVLEVPDVFYMDGKWVLTCLTGMNYSGRAVTEDPYASNATIVAYSESPYGPFVEEKDNILIAGPVQSGFTCRSVMRDGKRLLYYIDRAANGNALSLPKELQLNDGVLRAHYCSLTTLHQTEPLPLSDVFAETNSFAWKTYGGTAVREADGSLRLTTTEKDYHAVSYLMPPCVSEAGAAMLRANIEIDAEGGGLFIRAGGNAYVLFFEPPQQRVSLWKLYSFEPIAQRKWTKPTTACQIRCILADGVIELYVEDVLLLQCGLPTESLTHIGYAVDRGTLRVSNEELRALTR